MRVKKKFLDSLKTSIFRLSKKQMKPPYIGIFSIDNVVEKIENERKIVCFVERGKSEERRSLSHIFEMETKCLQKVQMQYSCSKQKSSPMIFEILFCNHFLGTFRKLKKMRKMKEATKLRPKR